MHTIEEVTDEQRAAEFVTSRAPHLVTKTGRISTYGMACGYMYCVNALHSESEYARLTMSLGGGEYHVDYFHTIGGVRARGFLAYLSKGEAEAAYRRLAAIVRADGRLDRTATPLGMHFTVYTD